MSQIRETTYLESLFKRWRTFFTSPPEKEMLSSLMKGAIYISLVLSIGFVFVTTFTTNTRWTPCPPTTVTQALQKNVPQITSFQDEDKTNVSHIVFGIGGSINTWQERRQYSALWWKPDITRGFVWLDEPPPSNLTWLKTSPPFQVSENTSSIPYTSWYGSRAAVRLARIVLETYRLGLSNVRWFVMGDDDTVFFVENLVNVLGKYDHNQMYYIGGWSESVEQDRIHSYGMAYGGGGYAISYPLVAQLVKILDGCLHRYSYFYGSDERIGACLLEIGVPVTREHGFHQLDVRGDAYGLLAAHPLTPLVSLHHLDYVDSLKPKVNQIDSLKSLMTAYEVDPARFMQQTILQDLKHGISISVSWGYTVQLFPTYWTAKDLQTPIQTFQTWKSWSPGPFTFDTRPMTETCRQPIKFFLSGVDRVGGETRTSYKKLSVRTKSLCRNNPGYVAAMGVRVVKVYSMKMQQTEWKFAPRRYCMEIIKLSWLGTLELRIRRCKVGETVTLP